MSYSNYSSEEKIHLIEQLLPHLEALLPIVRDRATGLINNGTVESERPRILSRNKKTFCEICRLHFDKPNASYQFIEVGIGCREEIFLSYEIKYVKWNKAGVDYSINWRIAPKEARWKTITKKFWFFRWKKKVIQYFQKIWDFDFDSRHMGENLSFRMKYQDLERMPIELHAKLCEILTAIDLQHERVLQYTRSESTRQKNEEKLKTIRHFEKLMNPSDTPK